MSVVELIALLRGYKDIGSSIIRRWSFTEIIKVLGRLGLEDDDLRRLDELRLLSIARFRPETHVPKYAVIYFQHLLSFADPPRNTTKRLVLLYRVPLDLLLDGLIANLGDLLVRRCL